MYYVLYIGTVCAHTIIISMWRKKSLDLTVVLAGLICPVPTGDLTDAKFSDLSGSGQLIQE